MPIFDSRGERTRLARTVPPPQGTSIGDGIRGSGDGRRWALSVAR
jgi:hypothetical protein